MLTAKLADNTVVNATDFQEMSQQTPIFCMDCRAPVHFVKESNKVAFFKTSGKGASVHLEGCAFAAPMTFTESVGKIMQLQKEMITQVEPIVVRLSLNKLDPEYVAQDRGRPNEQEVTGRTLKVPNDGPKQPKTLTTLKGLKKLFLTGEPDLLASVIISINGFKIPISELIVDQQTAHTKVMKNLALDVPYFVHGTITKIVRLPRVWYFNMNEDNYYFTLVVFERYFKYFTFKDEELIGHPILVMGKLKQNKFNEGKANAKEGTEIIIKSNDYLEFLD